MKRDEQEQYYIADLNSMANAAMRLRGCFPDEKLEWHKQMPGVGVIGPLGAYANNLAKNDAALDLLTEMDKAVDGRATVLMALLVLDNALGIKL